MKHYFTLSFIIGCLLLIFGCNRIKTPEAVAERENWIKSFQDSIEFYQNELESINVHLDNCNENINKLLQDFEHVKNAREVAGYYILKGWKAKIPLTSTGLYARISDDEEFELIATLSGGNFSRLQVSNGVSSVESGDVPNDQALNFRHAGYTTVCFIGNAADTVGAFIHDNLSQKLSVSFLGGSKNTSFVIPDNQKDMIAKTWKIISLQKEQKELQKELWLTSKRIDICRRMIQKSDSLQSLE